MRLFGRVAMVARESVSVMWEWARQKIVRDDFEFDVIKKSCENGSGMMDPGVGLWVLFLWVLFHLHSYCY